MTKYKPHQQHSHVTPSACLVLVPETAWIMWPTSQV